MMINNSIMTSRAQSIDKTLMNLSMRVPAMMPTIAAVKSHDKNDT